MNITFQATIIYLIINQSIDDNIYIFFLSFFQNNYRVCGPGGTHGADRNIAEQTCPRNKFICNTQF